MVKCTGSRLCFVCLGLYDHAFDVVDDDHGDYDDKRDDDAVLYDFDDEHTDPDGYHVDLDADDEHADDDDAKDDNNQT